ncbi:universal stress protein [Yoonia sp. F2084L]|uniref:universal stress protein n=1 Tax=Yoonia sp. F2084L TaxID=2926419 RepID=UPI001FF42E42|nr:universal stress protein [Yoonia sp. F2084L]MCK0097489.1 universal stress protein [Yoonia sp. F2084L]
MFADITVAIDGSDHGWRALEIACDLAKRYEGKIHLIHAPEMPPSSMAIGIGAIDVPVDMEQLMASGQAIMAQAADLARKSEVEPASQIVRVGVPSAEVIHTAEATGSDLIVTGRRGMGGIASLLLGSTSQKIAHDAPCACLTVK